MQFRDAFPADISRWIIFLMLGSSLMHNFAAYAQDTAMISGKSATTSSRQVYPAKTVRLVVCYAAGGNADLLSRIFAQKLREVLGQLFLVDNRGGAHGVLGTEIVAKAPADGYTLLFIAAGHTINAGLYPNLPFDTLKDFSAISQVGSTPLILAINASLPVANLTELVALAKSRPGQLNFASAGSGSSGHLSGVLLNAYTGIKTTHVPYKATAQAMSDLMSGQMQIMYPTATAVLPFIKAGKLRGLAITGRQRSAIAPDIVTFMEAGLPNFDTSTWTGIVAPAHTPRTIIDQLNAALVNIIKARDVRERVIGLGADPISSTPAEFHALIASDIQKWTKLIKESGVHLD